jgi:TfoX N-terminal domain
MAYSELLADRVRQLFKDKRTTRVEEKVMMKGMVFMVDDKMCVGVIEEELMARIGPIFYPSALEMPHCKPMLHTGRTYVGYVFIGAEGIDTDAQLEFWVQKALDFNPEAKSSKRKNN